MEKFGLQLRTLVVEKVETRTWYFDIFLYYHNKALQMSKSEQKQHVT